MKKITAAIFAATLALNARAVVVEWDADVDNFEMQVFDAYHGEDLRFEPSIYKDGTIQTPYSSLSASFYWQTEDMGDDWWVTNCTVAATYIQARFTKAMDPGEEYVRCFLKITKSSSGEEGDQDYRINWLIRYHNSPGIDPSVVSLPIPSKTLNFATVTVTNAPYYSKSEVDALIGSGSIDTNAVLDLIGVATNAVVTNAATAYFPNASGIAVSNTVESWETYWQGDSVKLEVTNYYNATSGELPRLRIIEKNGDAWRTVWDEKDRETNTQAAVIAAVESMTNGISLKLSQQVTRQTNNKAPRAWQNVTSAGEDAPPNTVWHTAPTTVFAGGTEYAHVSAGSGGIYVLTDNGAPAYTVGEEGKWRVQTDDGENYFGFDISSSYTLGCRTDGIEVDADANGNQIVTLTYDVTTSTLPTIYTTTNLTSGTWTAATVTWDDAPASGTQVAYVNAGTSPKGYYKAEIEMVGSALFETNMKANFEGGILCTNGTDAIEAVRSGNEIYWRTTDGTADSRTSADIGAFDFNGGTNFTRTLYTVLTNLIIKQGGTVNHTPTFE